MRLRSPGIEPAVSAVTIRFDGTPVSAFPGETIAAALIAASHYSQRHTQQGSPRGLFCGMGVCYDCLVTVDGRPSQRACLTKVRAGMVVASQQDGRVRPSAAGPPLASAPETTIPEENCDVLVVGAGPGGLAAAEAAAEAGAAVVVVDERPQAGGQYFKPLAPSQRTVDDRAVDAQFAEGLALTERVHRQGVTLLNEATVWGSCRDEDGRLEIGVLQNGRARILRPRQLIIATGAFERPLPVPGWTLPGVMTTGAAQTLARSYRVAPGERVLVVGNGPLNLQVACELARGSVRVLAVVEAAQPPWRRLGAALSASWHSPRLMSQGLGYLVELRRRGVALFYHHVLIRLDGVDRVETATVARLNGNGAAQPGSERRFKVDAVCMGYGFLPSTELARLLGCAHCYSDAGIGNLVTERDDTGKTSEADVYVVGEAGAIGGAQIALRQGRLAGWRAAAALGYPPPTRAPLWVQRQLRRQYAFQRSLWSLFAGPRLGLQFADADTLVCRCEEVTLDRVRPLIEEGITQLGALKRLTRVGMGRCQGRYCAALLVRLITDLTGRTPGPFDYYAPQLPLKPLPASALAAEKPEWGGHRRSLLPPTSARAHPAGPRLETDVLVIGAGIVGCSTAYFLARAGRDVLLIDREQPNAQASGANAGSLHVQLLSFDYGVKAEAGGSPAMATLPLQKASVALWRELERTLNKDFGIKISGGLMVAETERERHFLEAKIALEQAQGIEVELIGRNELRDLAPAVSERILGAAYCLEEGKINPLVATTHILASAVAAGARLHQDTQVIAIEPMRPGFTVTTNRNTIRCGRIVNAAGAWSARIAALVGINLPVHGAPLQMIVTEPAAPLVEQLVAHADRHLTLKQVANGNLIIGGGWTAGLDERTGFLRVLRRSIEGNLWVAQRVIPALAQLHVLRTWAAMNVNIDGAPVIGEVPGIAGFYNAVTSNGYTLGPIVGQLTAQLIVDGRTEWNLMPFSITRFGGCS